MTNLSRLHFRWISSNFIDYISVEFRLIFVDYISIEYRLIFLDYISVECDQSFSTTFQLNMTNLSRLQFTWISPIFLSRQHFNWISPMFLDYISVEFRLIFLDYISIEYRLIFLDYTSVEYDQSFSTTFHLNMTNLSRLHFSWMSTIFLNYISVEYHLSF